MSETRCPACGMSVPEGLSSCPLCRQWVSTVNLRRVALWSILVAEFLLIAVFHVGR
jgi:hypothetical protein